MEPRAEHVHVTDVHTADGQPAPGLLLGWQRVKGRWQGMVIAAAMTHDPEAGPSVTMHWVDEASIIRCGPGEDSAVWQQRPATPAQAAAPATAPAVAYSAAWTLSRSSPSATPARAAAKASS